MPTSTRPPETVQPTRVAVTAALILLVAGITVVWPLLTHHARKREELRSFQVADDPTQADIVRAYFEHELHRPPDAVVAGAPAGQPLYFDRKSAALCSLEHPIPCDRIEFLSAEREGALVDAADITVPLELQRLLDRIASQRTYNVDPHVAGVTTVATADQKEFVEACLRHPPGSPGHPEVPRLVRISRAAVHASHGQAIAMVLHRYCDRSSGISVVKFHRQGTKWAVAGVMSGG